LCSGQLALKYKLDNEFELVFVVAYQKMLPLLYLDKLLDELQLRSYLCTGLLIQKLDPDPHWQCSGSGIASQIWSRIRQSEVRIPDPDPSIIKQNSRENLYFYRFVTYL
jgi:hypothetical protein